MALFQDSRGAIWAGTEDKGLWCYRTGTTSADPKLPAGWTNFNVKDGLGDDTIYALAEDKLGRIWAGTLRNGVSVFNGREWRNYGVLDGPLGERVFAIATCPSDGDVWIATNLGLARYSSKGDRWSYYTRAEGLPSDQIQAIAFDSLGNIYVGSQCDGLAMAKSTEGYKNWSVVRGPDRMPVNCVGEGLPSSQINDLLVTDDETIYAATPCGLARSRDFGGTWSYLRGVDWEAKVRGQYFRNKPEAPRENLNRELLREDYVTNLGEDAHGLLLIGYRRKGYEYRRPLNDRVPFVSAKQPNDEFPYVSTVLPLSGGGNILANYGDGLTLAEPVPPFTPANEEKQQLESRRGWKTVTPSPTVPPLPARALAPSTEEIEVMKRKLARLTTPLQPGAVENLGDDWATWGDWVGRYGTHYAVMCSAQAPLDHYFVGDLYYKAQGAIGPHANKTDGLRHWMHWKKTDNGRVMYDPLIGYRRQAEWDDHGETYPMSFEGPDLWVRVKVPRGTHRLSLYFFNKDGHAGNNRIRDYLLEVYRDAATPENALEFKPLAQQRLRDFWGGVYKRFILSGSATYWVRIAKNNSFNTILSSVLLDKLSGPPSPFEGQQSAWIKFAAYEPPADSPSSATALTRAARELWTDLDTAQSREHGAQYQAEGRLMCLRVLAGAGWGNVKPTVAQRERGATPEIQTLMKRWRWQIPVWTASDRLEFNGAMQAGWEKLTKAHPELAVDDR